MSKNLNYELSRMQKYGECITEETELYKYIEQINNMIGTDGRKKVSIDKYKVRNNYKCESNPFLTVVIRTQGSRVQGLKEALLCLRGQSNQDFEVVLIAHKASEKGKEIVREIISMQPESLKNRINYIEWDEGTRTTPINVGCVNARGQYISIFDDDDILFDNWVNSFYEASKKCNGKILHAYVLAQDWKQLEGGYAAISAPTTQYCVEFDLLSQLVVNKCPLMGLAFPSYLFKEMKFTFNEELNVTEDWEFFMRAVFITGLHDITEPTSIYRFWKNAESSYSLHSNSTWEETYNKIQNYMDERSVIIPTGYTKHIVSLIKNINDENNRDNYFELGNSVCFAGVLYYANDEKFSDNNMLTSSNGTRKPRFSVSYDIPYDESKINSFRFDISEYGGMILSDVTIKMIYENEEISTLTIADCKHNGFMSDRGIYYLHYDPQLIWKGRDDVRVKHIEINGVICNEVPEYIIGAAINQERLLQKAKRKIKRMVSK